LLQLIQIYIPVSFVEIHGNAALELGLSLGRVARLLLLLFLDLGELESVALGRGYLRV